MTDQYPPDGILLVCATEGEASPFLSEQTHWLPAGEGLYVGQNSMNGRYLLITGPGMVNTAFRLGRSLDRLKPSLVINFGVAGSFEPGLPPPSVVEVVTDAFAELGAMSQEGFLDLEAIGLENFRLGALPVHNRVYNPKPSSFMLPKVSGITVNTVSGDAPGILRRKQLWQPQVETMEGAAFFQCCLLSGVSFYAFRAISNPVEPRNRANWKMKEAIASAHAFLSDFLKDL